MYAPLGVGHIELLHSRLAYSPPHHHEQLVHRPTVATKGQHGRGDRCTIQADDGPDNTGVGFRALSNDYERVNGNTAVGDRALEHNVTGADLILAIGGRRCELNG